MSVIVADEAEIVEVAAGSDVLVERYALELVMVRRREEGPNGPNALLRCQQAWLKMLITTRTATQKTTYLKRGIDENRCPGTTPG